MEVESSKEGEQEKKFQLELLASSENGIRKEPGRNSEGDREETRRKERPKHKQSSTSTSNLRLSRCHRESNTLYVSKALLSTKEKEYSGHRRSPREAPN